MLETGKAFYLLIEEGVKEYVKALRDAGLNTISSCHHEGYIQLISADPTTERHVIWNVMAELKITDWTAELYVNNLLTTDFWEIRSPKFKAEPVIITLATDMVQ